MKTKTVVIASVLAVSAVWLAADYRDTPDRPSDFRDAPGDFAGGAIGELEAVGGPAALSDASAAAAPDEDMAVFREFHYVRVQILAVNIDWAERLERNGEAWTAGDASSAFSEALSAYKTGKRAAEAPSKEAYNTVVQVNASILRILDEAARRLGGDNADHRAFGALFNASYEALLDRVAHSDSLAGMRSNAAGAADRFMNGAEKSAEGGFSGVEGAGYEKDIVLCGKGSGRKCREIMKKEEEGFRRVKADVRALTLKQRGAVSVLLRLKTAEGEDAELTGVLSTASEPELIAFDNIRMNVGGTKFRVGAGSSYLETLCKPYAAKYPYTYERVETRSWLERTAFIGKNGVVRTKSYQGDNIVVTDGACQREPY